MEFLTGLFANKNITQFDPQQLLERKKTSPKPFILDVREPEEYRSGHIEDAVLIPLGELNEKISHLPKGKDIICVCQSGSRSSVAANRLAKAGYQVGNLKGGMSRWLYAGLPAKKGMAK